MSLATVRFLKYNLFLYNVYTITINKSKKEKLRKKGKQQKTIHRRRRRSKNKHKLIATRTEELGIHWFNDIVFIDSIKHNLVYAIFPIACNEKQYLHVVVKMTIIIVFVWWFTGLNSESLLCYCHCLYAYLVTMMMMMIPSQWWCSGDDNGPWWAISIKLVSRGS